MINGTRLVKGNSIDIPYEIIFSATGNSFTIKDILAEDMKKVELISDVEIEAVEKETQELLSTYHSEIESEEYLEYLNQNGITLFSDES